MNKHITIKDIAREAGVSVSLVSFVMNNRIEADGKRTIFFISFLLWPRHGDGQWVSV